MMGSVQFSSSQTEVACRITINVQKHLSCLFPLFFLVLSGCLMTACESFLQAVVHSECDFNKFAQFRVLNALKRDARINE